MDHHRPPNTSRPEVTGKAEQQRSCFSSSQYPLCGQTKAWPSELCLTFQLWHLYLLSNYSLNYQRGSSIIYIKGNKLDLPWIPSQKKLDESLHSKQRNFSFHQCTQLLCTQDRKLEGKSEPKLQKFENLARELSEILSFFKCWKDSGRGSTKMSSFQRGIAVLVQQHSRQLCCENMETAFPAAR